MAKTRTNPCRIALEKAVAAADRDAIRRAGAALIDHIRTASKPLPGKDADAVLAALRGVREFELMQRVTDVLIQSGRDSFRVRRQYAQSQLDQGNITAAIEILKQLAADSKGKDRGEHNEARGLLGRAYKQLYVDAGGATGSWVVDALKKSVKHYYRVYKNDNENLWHGINAVAMLQRAKRDRVRLTGYPPPKRLAVDILDAVERKRKPPGWDLATAAEACVGLGDYDQALRWIHRYISDQDVSAFHLGSFERQLREVWGLDPDTPPGSLILPLVRRELLRREGATVDVSIEEIEAAATQRGHDEPHLEKILGRTGVQSYRWWLTALERARGVARIGLAIDQGMGTGFLVRGRDLAPKLGEGLVLMTNAHVVSEDPRVGAPVHPDEAVITFEAQGDTQQVYEVDHLLFSSPPGVLDVSILRLKQPVEGVEPYPLHPRLPAPNRARIYVIGHPQGGILSFSIQDNLLIARKSPKLHYRAPTEPGSSGSPVFNAQWKLIGLHHAGGHKVRRLNGKGTYAANEGIWIESIREAVQAEL